MSSWSIGASDLKSDEALGAKIGMSVCLWGGGDPFDGVAESAQPFTIVHENGHFGLDLQCTTLGKHVICHRCVKRWDGNASRDKRRTELHNGTVPVCFSL